MQLIPALLAVQDLIQHEAELSARALAGNADAALLGAKLSAERKSLWVLSALARVNVALGIWRRHFRRG